MAGTFVPRVACFVLICAVLAAGALPSAAAGPKTVGPLGDPMRLDVRGAKRISSEDVRRALSEDVQYQVASTPTAPLSDFLRVTCARVLLAYQRAGFGEATADVSVSPDGGGVVVDVVEGPRYVAGDVRVVGAKHVDANRLAAAVLAPPAPGRFPLTLTAGTARVQSDIEDKRPGSPLWRTGKPAPLDAVAKEWLTRDVERGLAEQGFFQTRFALQTRFDRATANLVVAIEDEGPRAVVGRVDVVGAGRNRPAGVIEFCGIEDGMSVDAASLQAVQGKLWTSGRFWRHSLALTPGDGRRADRATLRIEVDERDDVRPVGQELTAEEAAILRCNEWAMRAVADGSDLVLEATGGDARIVAVANNKRGVLLRAAPMPPRDGVPSPLLAEAPWRAVAHRLDAALLVGPGRAVFYDVGGGRRLAWVGTAPLAVAPTVRWLPQSDPNSAQKSSILIGLPMVTTASYPNDPPIRFDARVAPVCALQFLYPPGEKAACETADGVLTVRSGAKTLRLDARTGRLIEFRYEGPGQFVIRVTVEAGAMDRELRVLDGLTGAARGAGHEASVGGAELIGAVLGHAIANCPGDVHADRRAAAGRALGSLIAPVAAGAGELIGSLPDFHVPPDPVPNANAGGLQPLFGRTVPTADRLCTRLSWPWTLARESLQVVAGNAPHANLEAGRMFNSPDVGPVGYWAVARALSVSNDPGLARVFARRGLEFLTPERFQADCGTLAAGETTLARSTRGVVRALRELPDGDVDALATVLGDRAVAMLKIVRGSKGQGKDEWLTPVAPALQRALWDGGMRDALRSSLTGLAETPSKGK